MDSILSVTTPADDYALLTVAELRAAAGVSDKKSDPALKAIGLEAAERIAEWCRIATANGSTPTVKAETLTETYRLHRGAETLILSRRFAAVTSITENGATLTAGTDFEANGDAGLIKRLRGERECWWPCATVVVVYRAGFAEIPATIKGVVMDFVRMRLSQRGRDPLVRSETTDGVDSVTYRDGSNGDSDFEEIARVRLSRFMNPVIG